MARVTQLSSLQLTPEKVTGSTMWKNSRLDGREKIEPVMQHWRNHWQRPVEELKLMPCGEKNARFQ